MPEMVQDIVQSAGEARMSNSCLPKPSVGGATVPAQVDEQQIEMLSGVF